MNDISYFKKFVPKNDAAEKVNFIVWSYTRVSSKEQFDKNSSIARQIEANNQYAILNNYIIAEDFGGTYESAKSDFTRKELKRLVDKVNASRKRPYAILVYKMSRFSRSGGGAIGLVNGLVENLGVHLIEVCSGLSTTTPRGKAAIYESLFHAHKENLERREIILPSMKAYLLKGNLLGQSGVGYDHYGPRVTNEKFFAMKQKIVINSDGELLKEAWKWKASGLLNDAQILDKLSARGLHLLPQKISKIWRNPFYCGVLVNKLIEEPVKGNWEPLVSHEDFIKVQEILEGNTTGYQNSPADEGRPLTRLLKCGSCNRYMVGQVVKKKNLHYYRCLKCAGYNLNAKKTDHAKRDGAHELFIDFLKQYIIPEEIVPLVKAQLIKLFNHYNEDILKDDLSLKAQFSNVQSQIKDLKLRHALGNIDKESYDLGYEHLSKELQQITKELNNIAPKISNLDTLLSKSLKKLQNLSEIWVSSDLENKRRIQNTLFPDGIIYDAEKHEYRTENTNRFIRLTSSLVRVCAEKQKGNFQDLLENSLDVARTGIEPVIPP